MQPPVAADPNGFDTWVGQFLTSLAGKSPRTYLTYESGLARFREFLQSRGELEAWQPEALHPNTLEAFYGWLIRRHSRQRRATVATYSSGVRAFVRFVARRGRLRVGVTYEQMRDNVREVMGRSSYKTPRIDRRLPLLVTHVLDLPLPAPTERRGIRRKPVQLTCDLRGRLGCQLRRLLEEGHFAWRLSASRSSRRCATAISSSFTKCPMPG